MRHQLPILVLILLAACSGSDPKSLTSDGYAALGRGDDAKALSKFESALNGLGTEHPQYRRAALGRCEALTKVDAARARAAFLDLAKVVPEQVNEDDYSLMCNALLQVDANLHAVEVMHAGRDRFKGSKKMEAILEAVLNAAKRARTPEALQRLTDLGYV